MTVNSNSNKMTVINTYRVAMDYWSARKNIIYTLYSDGTVIDDQGSIAYCPACNGRKFTQSDEVGRVDCCSCDARSARPMYLKAVR